MGGGEEIENIRGKGENVCTHLVIDICAIFVWRS